MDSLFRPMEAHLPVVYYNPIACYSSCLWMFEFVCRLYMFAFKSGSTRKVEFNFEVMQSEIVT